MKDDVDPLLVIIVGITIIVFAALGSIVFTQGIFVFGGNYFDLDQTSSATISLCLLLLLVASLMIVKAKKIRNETDESKVRIHTVDAVDTTGFIVLMIGLVMSFNRENWNFPSGLDHVVAAVSCIILGWASWLSNKAEQSKFHIVMMIFWAVALCLCVYLTVTGKNSFFNH